MVIQTGVVGVAVAAAMGLGVLLYYIYESATQTPNRPQSYRPTGGLSYNDNIYNSQARNRNTGNKCGNSGSSGNISRPNECLEEKCSICQEILPTRVMTLPCNHSFHGSCITKWIYTNPYCPNCRESIS